MLNNPYVVVGVVSFLAAIVVALGFTSMHLHAKLSCAMEHINLAFHPELGWAVSAKDHADLYKASSEMFTATVDLIRMNQLKVALGNELGKRTMSPGMYRDANLRLVNGFPLAWDRAAKAVNAASTYV